MWSAGLSSWKGGFILEANYLMRNNAVDYVNSIMGNRFVENQRISAFMGVAFDALWHGKKAPSFSP
ncbi:MAG: hypothetical protein B7Z37_18935 [Verrucomicrobia bacterium 12-59-8]|nr:MAG: hypothetical protein B7Z37_18935 [Verrucomicrobia bacterium 12-59-8]